MKCKLRAHMLVSRPAAVDPANVVAGYSDSDELESLESLEPHSSSDSSPSSELSKELRLEAFLELP